MTIQTTSVVVSSGGNVVLGVLVGELDGSPGQMTVQVVLHPLEVKAPARETSVVDVSVIEVVVESREPQFH